MKVRADLLLVKKGLVSSRSEAQSLIMAGRVFSGRGRIDKAGHVLDEKELLEVRRGPDFVSRGGVKLDHALREFRIYSTEKVCLDVGASTGGFTDCLLQSGARKVYAVDVGYGQFHPKLRNDPRVVLFEKSNFRYFDRDKIPEEIDLAVVDVSFISLRKILPALKAFLRKEGEVVALVKPQFEVGPKGIKKGVVRSEALKDGAVQNVAREASILGFGVLGKVKSPILGPAGNEEFFLSLKVS